MGTIAEKLTYLNTTKEKIRNSINLTGANLTSEDTFRSYATKLKKGYIDIINNGTDNLYNNFPKVSEIGSNLSLTPTYEAPMKLNEIQGNTLQENTPTPDTPVEIQSVTGLQNVNITGKNLFDIQKLVRGRLDNGVIGYESGTTNLTLNENSFAFTTNANYRGVVDEKYILLEPSTNYVFKCSVSSGLDIRFSYYDKNKTFISAPNPTTLSDGSKKLTSPANARYGRLGIQLNTAGTITIENPQLEQGSTATSYEPYKGNTYEVNLGKNLLYNKDITSETTQYGVTITPNNDGTITLNGTNTKGSDIYINFYTGDYTSSGKFSINNIGNTLQTQTKDGYTLSISCSNGTINIGHNKNNGIWSIVVPNGNSYTNANIQFQLEKGTQSTSFSPYFTPIELNKIGTYQDSIKKSTGKNLLNAGNGRLGTFSGLTISYSNGDIILNGTTSSLVDFYVGTNVSTPKYNEELINYMNTNLGAYTLSNNLGFENYFRIGGSYLQNTGTTTSTNKVDLIFVRIPAGTYNNKVLNIMLNEGSTALPYEPYGKVWYVEKNIGNVVLDGSETYDVAGTNTSGKYRIRYDGVVNLIKRPANAGTIGDIISNQFIPLSANYTYRCNQGISVETNGKISFYDETITQSTSAFTTWLASNNMTIKYALATPTYTEITNTELINQLETLYTAKSQEGTTNISITSEDLEMILNVSALKGEE